MASNGFVKIVLSFIALIVVSCAKIGTPTGGPKDVTPPKVVESTPPMNSVNFKGKKIEITFDEFVQLVDINKNFVISPPMKKKPMVLMRNKSVIIDLEENLKPNTTYRLYFGNAIVDNNEKNQLKNFEFVFSTGNVVDSLSLRGRVVDAFDHKPDKDSYYVMLYDKFQDSIPRKQLPQYITKTDEKGWFSFTHIRPDTFMIFALKDMNMNYLFDLPNEPIAFSDTLIPINSRYFMPDSLVKPDSSAVDSTQRGPFKAQIRLYSFTENHERQYLKKEERGALEKFDLIFNAPPDTLQITPLNFNKKDWLVRDSKVKSDTMSYWITDTSIVYKDTLKLRLGYTVLDSLERPVPKYDTISLVVKKPVGGKARLKVLAKKIAPLSIASNVGNQATLDLNNMVVFTPSHPLASVDSSKIQLTKIVDGKKSRMKYTIRHDSVYLRRYFLNFKIEPETDYQLTTDTMAFKDVFGFYSDSTGYKFKSQKDDYYGRIKLKVENVKEQMIIQLFTGNDNLVSQKIIDKDQEVLFDYLAPGKYKVKAIYDRNRNKVWDTGNFAQRLQPEKVMFYYKELPVRSNWDVEEDLKLE
jgi:hypothetical protein